MNTYERDALLVKANDAYFAIRSRYRRYFAAGHLTGAEYFELCERLKNAFQVREEAIHAEFDRQEREAFKRFDMRFRFKALQHPLEPGIYNVQIADVKTENVRGGKIVTFSMVHCDAPEAKHGDI